MRMLMCLLLSVTALPAEKPAAETKAAKPAFRQSAGRAQAPAAVALPRGAVEVQPGTWRYTDQQGRNWIYRNTPFGIARFEEKIGRAHV